MPRWISGNLYWVLQALKNEKFDPEDALVIIKEIKFNNRDFINGALETFGPEFLERLDLIFDTSDETLFYAIMAIFNFRSKAEFEDISTGDL